jgi:hypothetical protein
MRKLIPVLAGLLILALALPAGALAKPKTFTPVTEAVTGTITNAAGTVVGTAAGQYEITRFVARDGGIVALGTFTGTRTVGGVVTPMTSAVELAVTPLVATCDILHLELGPLDLDVLGLVIHLDRVVLDIDAEQGPGNLLGNLLCAIAGLLDPGPGPLAGIVALLNQILSILQGI